VADRTVDATNPNSRAPRIRYPLVAAGITAALWAFWLALGFYRFGDQDPQPA